MGRSIGCSGRRCCAARRRWRRIGGFTATKSPWTRWWSFCFSIPDFRARRAFVWIGLEAALERIEEAASASRAIRPHLTPLAQNSRTVLRQSSVEQVISSGLHEFLMEVQDHCAAIGSMIFDKYLRFE